MARSGELTYYERLSETERRHATNKPFTDAACGLELMRVGALFSLLTPPPARILECGCGMGWLSRLLARRGYQVVGVDVSPIAIRMARDDSFADAANLEFEVADAEHLDYDQEFDAVLFYDALHHAVDEFAALRSAYRALKAGGVCIALEPGDGHAARAREFAQVHEVTEKDMPPRHVCRLGKRAGFARTRMLPAPQQLGKALYAPPAAAGNLLRRLMRVWPTKCLAVLAILLKRRSCGITVLYKDANSATQSLPSRR
jgi:SAM-dependent methyltransferase